MPPHETRRSGDICLNDLQNDPGANTLQVLPVGSSGSSITSETSEDIDITIA